MLFLLYPNVFTPHNHTLTRHEHTLTRHEHTLGIFAPTSGPIATTGIEALFENYNFCLPMVYGSYVLLEPCGSGAPPHSE